MEHRRTEAGGRPVDSVSVDPDSGVVDIVQDLSAHEGATTIEITQRGEATFQSFDPGFWRASASRE
jgi:hypothetical protein